MDNYGKLLDKHHLENLQKGAKPLKILSLRIFQMVQQSKMMISIKRELLDDAWLMKNNLKWWALGVQ